MSDSDKCQWVVDDCRTLQKVTSGTVVGNGESLLSNMELTVVDS